MKMELRAGDVELGFEGDAKDCDDVDMGRRNPVPKFNIGLAESKERGLFRMRAMSLGTLDMAIRGRNVAESHSLEYTRQEKQSKQ